MAGKPDNETTKAIASNPYTGGALAGALRKAAGVHEADVDPAWEAQRKAHAKGIRALEREAAAHPTVRRDDIFVIRGVAVGRDRKHSPAPELDRYFLATTAGRTRVRIHEIGTYTTKCADGVMRSLPDVRTIGPMRHAAVAGNSIFVDGAKAKPLGNRQAISEAKKAVGAGLRAVALVLARPDAARTFDGEHADTARTLLRTADTFERAGLAPPSGKEVRPTREQLEAALDANGVPESERAAYRKAYKLERDAGGMEMG